MRAVGPPADGNSRQAFLQGVQAVPVHEDDHARGNPRFAPTPAVRNRSDRGRARGRETGAGTHARAEHLSANVQSGARAAARESMAGTAARPTDEELARPMVAVDTVLFAINDGRLQTYLVELRRGPGRGRWAFPGGLVRVGELLDDAARRELHDSTGLRGAYLEQLFTFGDPSRDPRAHVVSVAYMALIPDVKAVSAPCDKYANGKWYEVTRLPQLAYDHSLMAAYAVKRLKSKLEYTNIAYALLPKEFTFAEFEELYSLVLGRPLDRRNFRRSILAMGMLKRLPHTRRGPHRPAALYSFANQSLRFIEML